MKIGTVKGSSMIVKMARSLVEEGWSFMMDEFDVIVKAEHKASGEAVSFNSMGTLKRWMYEKALSY